ncbi:MAG: C25 family cysteine peptidase [Bacteroidota bacterium]
MKVYFSLISALFLSAFLPSFSSEPIEIITRNSGAGIVFKNPEITFSGRSQHRFPRISNNAHLDYMPADSAALEQMTFTLAVPFGSNIKAELRTFRFKKVNNSRISDTFKNSFKDLQPTINVLKPGIKRGVQLVNIEFQPYRILNGEIFIADSAIIDVDFGVKNAFDNTAVISLQDAEFFKGILNQSQLPSIFQQSLKAAKTFKNSDHILKAENTWYEPEKNYVKIITTRDGVAKLSMRDILTAQPAFKNKNSANFHMIFKGEPYPFAFINDNNQTADETDEIIFLGKRAAGDTTWFDTYTKEAVFYLTYDESTTGSFLKAMPQIGNPQAEISKVDVKYHFEEEGEFSWGDTNGITHRTEAVTGEGFYWKMLNGNGQSFETAIPLMPTGEDAMKISMRIHASGYHPDYNPDLILYLDWNGKKVDSAFLNNPQDYVLSADIPGSQLLTGNNLIKIESLLLKSPGGLDTNKGNGLNVDFITAEGLAKPYAFDGTARFGVAPAQDAKVKIPGFKSEKVYVIDPVLKEFSVVNAQQSGNVFTGELILKGARNYSITATDNVSVETALVAPVGSTNLLKESNQADVLIITHGNFKNEAQRLAEYRAKTRGLKVQVVDVADVFKEFDFGRHSPFAIKKFLQHSYESWQKPAPAYVILVGDASWDARKVLNQSFSTDFVPTYGHPVSDYWYTMLDGDDHLAEMQIGRLAVSTAEQAGVIVNKLMEYDTLPPQPWMKRFMAITGGNDIDEAGGLHDTFAGQVSLILTSPDYGFAGDTTLVSRYQPATDTTEAVLKNVDGAKLGNEARLKINEGVVWASFLGHGSPEIIEIPGWESDKLTNGKRYFFLSTFSCQTGAFAEPGRAMNEEFVYAENKGAIAAFGTTGFGYQSIDAQLLYRMIEGVTLKKLRGLGEIIDYAKQMIRPDEGIYRQEKKNSALQYSLLGDPLTRLPIDTIPDLYMMQQDVQKYAIENVETYTVDNDSAHMSFVIRNNGTNYRDSVFILATREYNGRRDTIWSGYVWGVGFKTNPIAFTIPIRSMPGLHQVKIIVDPQNLITENRKDNNVLSVNFDVYEKTPLALDPLPFWDVDSQRPVFKIINPFKTNGKFDYDFVLMAEKDGAVDPQEIISASTRGSAGGISVDENYIEWLPQLQLTAGKGYVFKARLYNQDTKQESDWLSIPFTATNSFKNQHADWMQHTSGQLSSNSMSGLEITGDSARISLKPMRLPVSITSVAIPRFVEIKVGDTYHVSDEISGMKIVVYSPYDLKEINSRFYNMVYIGPPDYTSIKHADSIIAFLNDSVPVGSYVLVGIAEDGIRGAIGYSKTPPDFSFSDSVRHERFKEAFHSIGSRLIDSVREYQSFAVFGRKGLQPGEAIEVWNGGRDSVNITTELPIFTQDGWLSTPMAGPAKKWDSISIAGVLPLSVEKWKWKITALNNNKSESKVIYEGDSLLTFHLDSLSAHDYPFLKTEVSIPKTVQNENLFLKQIKIAFEPEAEIAIVPSKTFVYPNDEVLRGDTVVNTLAIQNISGRSDSRVLKVEMKLDASNGSHQEYITHTIPVLKPGATVSFQDTIGTDNLTLQSKFNFAADTANVLNELYTFNNSSNYPFVIADDSLPPVIDLFFDGKTVESGDLIQLKPSVLIRIWDNSRLAVASSNTEILVNSHVNDSALFIPKFHRQTPRIDTVAEYTFSPQDLENGENSFIIIATDATGNSTEKRIKLIVSMNYTADEIKNSPNPFSDGTTFTFTYKGQELSVPGNVEIHNISGQKVRDMDFTAELGETTFFWDGRDNIGRQLPAGMYFYKIQLRGLINTESAYGKCVIVR